MFRSYDHLQAEIYTWKLTMLLCNVVCSWRTDKWLLFCESVLCCCRGVFSFCWWGGCGWFFMLFVVVYYGIEDRDVNVCVYVVKV
jgi:hypothetical protein